MRKGLLATALALATFLAIGSPAAQAGVTDAETMTGEGDGSGGGSGDLGIDYYRDVVRRHPDRVRLVLLGSATRSTRAAISISPRRFSKAAPSATMPNP